MERLQSEAIRRAELLKRMGDTLELLSYPYPIEHNTIKNILFIVTGHETDELKDWKTHDVLYIARMLKNGIIPTMEEIHNG